VTATGGRARSDVPCAISRPTYVGRFRRYPVMSAHHHRHRRIRRTKKWLRYMPRRAMFHRYPFIGRFAELARRRAYLWSFKQAEVRPAIYAGSILSFMPAMGVQLPLALALCLIFRANFMVMGGLQFISNPFTAAPLYYATHKVGTAIIDQAGFGASIEPSDPVVTSGGEVADDPHPALAASNQPELHWTRRLGNTINALILGGLVVGTAVGFSLDMVYRIMSRPFSAPRSTDPPRRRE